MRQIDPFQLESLVPATMDLEQRILLAERCRDSDVIPKVPNAGCVMTRNDGVRVQVMHNGLAMLADGYYGNWMTRLIEKCRGHHEPQEELVFHEVVKHLSECATMLELGGFWAYYSLWFLRNQPSRKAIVLEPDPAHRAVGEVNARLNNLRPCFVSGFIGSGPADQESFVTEESGKLLLPRFSVAQLLVDQGIERLDLLHCDTQGAEVDVLTSCVELFERRLISWAFVSTHAHQISGDPLTHQRCLALLQNAGAKIVAEHDVYESFSGDGLIVAHFGQLSSDWFLPQLSRNRYSESYFRNPLYDLAELRKSATSELPTRE